MEIHQIRYFLAVARTGNFSRAALECHVSQPSLSQQIQKLEDELGQALFDRQPGGSTLTQAGELFLPYARQIAGAVEESLLRVQESSGRIRGRLLLGVLPTIAPYLLPQLLKPFSRVYPEVEVIVQEEITPRLLEGLSRRELDLALLSTPVTAQGFSSAKLFTEPLLLVLPQTHALAKKKTISLEALPQERFILMQEGHCLADQALEFCHARAGFTPQVSCRSAQVQTLLALVASGLGISIIPEMAAKPMAGLVYRRFSPRSPQREVGFVWRRNRYRSPAGKALIQLAREALRG